VNRADLIAPQQMLEIVRDLGYTGIELGPPGYFGADEREVASTLEQYGLELAGAFAPLRIADENGFLDDLAFLDATIDVLAATGCSGPLVLAGDANETRLAAAARPDAQQETALRGEEFARAAERVERAARRAHVRGVTATFHPHIGTCIESPEEIAALLDATDPDVVSICFDTGHTVVGGGDPLELAVTARDRIAHLHLKDVEPRILERLRSRELTVEQAWEQGLFCRLGDGVVDFDTVLAKLDDYSGWAVVEQDRIAVRPADLEAVREIEAHNLAVVGGRPAHSRGTRT
jgi:inosose dehydratase